MLLVIVAAGCKGSDNTTSGPVDKEAALKAALAGKSAGSGGSGGSQPLELDKQCEQLAKVCADTGKHVEKMLGECTSVATTQVAKGCTDKALAAYSCYQTQLCMGPDKVWTLDDMRVLSERHGKCVAERDALRACAGQ